MLLLCCTWIFDKFTSFPPSRKGYFQKNLVGMCGQLSFPKPLPYLWLKSVVFPTPFMAWPKLWYSICDRCSWHSCHKHGLWKNIADGLIGNDEEKASSKKSIKHTLLMTKMAKINTLFMTKTAQWKPIPLKTKPAFHSLTYSFIHSPSPTILTLDLLLHSLANFYAYFSLPHCQLTSPAPTCLLSYLSIRIFLKYWPL